MRILSDECVAPSIVTSLRAEGHDVISVLESSSASDIFVLSFAEREQRVLLAEDNDYGELVFHRALTGVPGVILIRMLESRAAERWRRLKSVLDDMSDRVFGSYIVIERVRTRIKKLPRDDKAG